MKTKKPTQAQTNPYKYSDSNKRYRTFDSYMKHRFGGKIARVPLDAGFTCPNKDGTCGESGCIFCLSGSSGAVGASLREQYEHAVATASGKWSPVGYIPYLQANTNTYAEPSVLRRIYEEAASLPFSVMLDVATRADCLSQGAVDELVRISEKIPVTVELGLQSASDKTAKLIRRGHDLAAFIGGYRRLREAGGNIEVCVHIINGLPCETYADMMNTAREVARLAPEQVKIHLLNVLKGTPLEKMYLSGEYVPMEREAYVKTVCDQLEILPCDTVIARITGDSVSDVLAAPDWARKKTVIANMIDRELYERDSYQGKYYEKQ